MRFLFSLLVLLSISLVAANPNLEEIMSAASDLSTSIQTSPQSGYHAVEHANIVKFSSESAEQSSEHSKDISKIARLSAKAAFRANYGLKLKKRKNAKKNKRTNKI
jgi:hypothetical protein